MKKIIAMHLPTGTNYVEVFVGSSCDIDNQYQIGLDENTFYALLQKMHHKNYKFFQRVFKEYIYNDMVCQCHTNDEVKVFRLVPLNVLCPNKGTFVQVCYQRTKLTLLNFPSTRSIHQIHYVKQLIFRVLNRIYINFRVSVDDTTRQKTYQIFINYNHEENLEMSPVLKTLDELLMFLKPPMLS